MLITGLQFNPNIGIVTQRLGEYDNAVDCSNSSSSQP